jgi:O-Antigen ligase
MGLFLSILYFVTHYLTPAFLFGPLADAHIELILAVLVLVVSLPALIRSFILKSPQSLALVGLAAAVFLSQVFGRHWVGGGVKSLLQFIPNGLSYFLVCLHCNTKKRFKALVAMLFFVIVIVISHGYSDLRHGVPESAPPPGVGLGNPIRPGATASPYLMRQMNSMGHWIFRLQGLGEINDPNDFGQLIVCVIPLMFIFWRIGSPLVNTAFVILPVCVLLFGVFLTHSRGALVALTVVAVVAARRRIGTAPAIVLAGTLFGAAMALQFTGGRDISASAGEDRTALWGEGMALLKTHPMFGVGFGDLWEHTDGYLTAHNSVIVCAGELGLFGLYFWSLFLFPTLRDALAIASPEKVSPAEAIIDDEVPFSHAVLKVAPLEKAEINSMGRLIFLSLIGFLAAGWFLSRAFVATLFLLGGMAEAVYQMALRRGMIAPRLPFARVLPYSAGLAVCLIVAMYILIRILNFVH